MDDVRIVKGFFTSKFEVEMTQDSEGRYRIRYEAHGNTEFSEWITDYGTASYMFDLKVQELEGH